MIMWYIIQLSLVHQKLFHKQQQTLTVQPLCSLPPLRLIRVTISLLSWQQSFLIVCDPMTRIHQYIIHVFIWHFMTASDCTTLLWWMVDLTIFCMSLGSGSWQITSKRDSFLQSKLPLQDNLLCGASYFETLAFGSCKTGDFQINRKIKLEIGT